MRRRWVMRKGQFVELDLEAPLPPRMAPYVVSDISAYRSAITREMITSRSQHREHLRLHNCVEYGNDMPTPTRHEMPPVSQDVQRALEASPETHAEARAAAERGALI